MFTFSIRSRVSSYSMNNCMKTPPEVEELDSLFIAPEVIEYHDKEDKVDRSDFIIWQCVNRIESNLNSLLEKRNIKQSHEVLEEEDEDEDKEEEEEEDDDPSTMDDYNFLLLLPLNHLENVIELESRLSDDTSDFRQKLMAFITPTYKVRTLAELKRMVRTILRRLFTYDLASLYSWRGFRGNFQIGNLKIVSVIFDISKYKLKNAQKPYVNTYIKEWIRYAKQRRHQLNKIKLEQQA